ncbi:unnamed protein product [Cochlearia groenlandica]
MASTFFFFFIITSFFYVVIHGLSDTECLLKFKKSLIIGRASALDNWDIKNPPCKWNGVLCHNGYVWGLRLENLELSGSLNVEALARLKSLRSLSFMNNKLGGPFPEFKKLGALKTIYLSNNQYNVKIPVDAFDGMAWLKKIHLEYNNFGGEIPSSIAKLPKLLELRLDGNRFTGKIPEFTHKLHILNLTNNALSGQIPKILSTMDQKLIEGNKGLCGKPLDKECYSSPYNLSPEPNSGSSKKTSKFLYIIAAVVGAILAVFIILGLVVLICRRKGKKQQLLSSEPPGPSSLQKRAGIQEREKEHSSNCHSKQHHVAKNMIHTTKLSFLRDDKEKFELQDLLKASAEILGSGCFGASYKALLSNSSMVVVKRFKHMDNLGAGEFQEHMKRLGRLKHDNLLPIVAYYYKKEEKLFVCDFVEKGSLAAHLHGIYLSLYLFTCTTNTLLVYFFLAYYLFSLVYKGQKSLGQPSLDWPRRLNIVKGVGRGLLYLHENLPSLMASHGHLKSSNVLLDDKFEPVLTDYGLIPMINEENAQDLMMAYKSPEYLKQSRITKKTDVWGFGVLILEILTGKLPESFPQGIEESDEDISNWVKSNFQGEWKQELFDQEMHKTNNCETYILKLLRIGLSCCEVDVEKRLDIREVVEMISDLTKEREEDDDFYSTYASEADGRSTRGLSSEGINLL